MTFSKWSFW